MDLVKIMETFPTQEDCIAYLERIKWQGSPQNAHIVSTHAAAAMKVIRDV